MALDGTYQYRSDHVISQAASAALHAALADDSPLPAGTVVGAFQLPDGAVARVAADGAAGFCAECIGRPPSTSASPASAVSSLWRRFKYLVRTLLQREGGRAWKLDARRTTEIRQWLADLRQTEDARRAVLRRQQQFEHVRKVGAARAEARFDAGRAEAPPLATVLADVLPTLDGVSRLHLTSVCTSTWGAGKHERGVAAALVQAGGIVTIREMRDALSNAAALRDSGTLSPPQYSELVAALARRIPFLPPPDRRAAVLQVASQIRRGEAAMRARGGPGEADMDGAHASPQGHLYSRAAVAALVQVVRDDEVLYSAGAALIDPVCHLIDRLRPTSDGLDTPEQRWRTYRSMMAQPSRIPAIARHAWAALIPRPSEWLDAVAHLHPRLRRDAVALLAMAATATRDKTGEREEVRQEVAERWRAMADAALALPDEHALKGVALEALVQHWPKAPEHGVPAPPMPLVKPSSPYLNRIGAAAQSLPAERREAVLATLQHMAGAAA